LLPLHGYSLAIWRENVKCKCLQTSVFPVPDPFNCTVSLLSHACIHLKFPHGAKLFKAVLSIFKAWPVL
jgi:hypothetical protein